MKRKIIIALKERLKEIEEKNYLNKEDLEDIEGIIEEIKKVKELRPAAIDIDEIHYIPIWQKEEIENTDPCKTCKDNIDIDNNLPCDNGLICEYM